MNDLASGNRERRQVLLGIFGVIFLIFVIRLFYLQILSPEFAARADENAVKRVIIQPARGILYDRKGEIYVTNIPLYDLYVIPRELKIPDTNALAKLLQMPRPDLERRLHEADSFSRIKPSVLRKQVSAEEFTFIQEHLWQYRGIYTQVRTTRTYMAPVGANFLGYISEVDKQEIAESDGYYRMGDAIGRSGLERQYEELLRGRKGVNLVMVDVHGREVGAFADGRYDTLPRKGVDLQISVDLALQAYGELLMQNKKGSIVAIEPATGEILAFVSSPVYDPNLLAGSGLLKNFTALQRDSLKPLFNRALMAKYPPGSIFKLLTGLSGLANGTLTPDRTYGCGGGFMRNGGRPRCHAHPSPLDLAGAVQHSCNAYFAAVYVDEMHHSKFTNFEAGFEAWYAFMDRMSMGRKTGIDIPNEKAGRLPSKQFYDKWYGAGRWKAMTNVSNSIGQGEIEMTPLQMANMAAMIANRGYYIRPHFFKQLYNYPDSQYVQFERVESGIDTASMNVMVEAMHRVVEAGTGYIARIPGLEICGKTGTAENPHGDDHSVFVAFAPKDNPKIAISVIVENGGFGAQWAAPIASLLIDKYINDTIHNVWLEKYVLDGNLIHKYLPRRIGTTDTTTQTSTSPQSAPIRQTPSIRHAPSIRQRGLPQWAAWLTKGKPTVSDQAADGLICCELRPQTAQLHHPTQSPAAPTQPLHKAQACLPNPFGRKRMVG